MSVTESLADINQELAARRTAAGNVLAALSDRERESFDSALLALAGEGWHTWEAAAACLDDIDKVLPALGPAGLLAHVQFGHQLAQQSYEPALAWFAVSQELLAAGRAGRLARVRDGAALLATRHRQAALLTAYFAVARDVALDRGREEVAAWHELLAEFAGAGREQVARLLQLTGEHPLIQWTLVVRAGAGSVYTALAWLEQVPGIMSTLPDPLVTAAADLVRHYSKGPVSGLLERLAHTAPALGVSESLLLMQSATGLASVEQAESVVAVAARLPLARRAVVDLWVSEGRGLGERNPEAGVAWFALESARSIDRLRALEGELHVPDTLRVLQLFCEAITGTRLLLTVEEDPVGLPRTEALSVRLPERVAAFPALEDNFAWMKLALMHQMAFFEFNTFALGDNRLQDTFATYEKPALARSLFIVIEEARVDWCLRGRYRGLGADLDRIQNHEAAGRPLPARLRGAAALLEVMVQSGLGLTPLRTEAHQRQAAADLTTLMLALRAAPDDVSATFATLQACYAIIAPTLGADAVLVPRPVSYRGTFDPVHVQLTARLLAVEERLEELGDSDEDVSLGSLIDPKNLQIEKLEHGDLQDAMGEFLTELEDQITEGKVDKETLEEGKRRAGEVFDEAPRQRAGTVHYYDEWDYLIDDYRRRWCTLFEISEHDEDADFVADTTREHASVAAGVRRQLRMLKPERSRKVRGLPEGEELDLERTIEAIVDRRSGVSPGERIYVQRQKKERDVAALFLVDMSASTDDRIPEPDEEVITAPDPEEFRDEVLDAYYRRLDERDRRRKRIIDVEKQAVVLMANALEGLGDNYSICGFSGYGRDRVEYYLCKDFDQPYNYAAKARIGGMKPCRSTRMGPAIRHATRSLSGTESRVKALIIISDGYPQDFDYGRDRNDRTYGIADTTRALAEARQRGIQTFCLTVDQAGHDYLREMCPDQQYMVIHEMHDLPGELSKVYRSLTG